MGHGVAEMRRGREKENDAGTANALATSGMCVVKKAHSAGARSAGARPAVACSPVQEESPVLGGASASNSASAGAGGKRRSRSGGAGTPYFGAADFGAGAGGRSVARFWAAQNWHASYVRTRQKNLRCFPFCASTHKDHSFCGESIRILVTVASSAAAMSLSLEGCFRKVKEDPHVALGTPRSALRWPEDELVSGCLSCWDPFSCVAVFDFAPSRKWRYRCSQNKHRSMDSHAFTVATFDALGICVDLVDSPHFRIVSAWLQNISSVARPLWGMPGSAPLAPGSGEAPRRHLEEAGWSEQPLNGSSGSGDGAGLSGNLAHEAMPGASLAEFAGRACAFSCMRLLN